MPPVTAHAPGCFCWVELGTTDQAAAVAFYGGLLGWRAHDVPMGDGTFYTVFTLDGRDVAALYGLRAEQRAKGIGPHWLPYVAVANADESAARVTGLGGRVLAAPFDVLDVGRTFIIRDPGGAVLACYQAKTHMGLGVMDEPGAVSWCELATQVPGRMAEFYAGLFGWEARASTGGGPPYTDWVLGGTPVGGMLEVTAASGGGPAQWAVCFQVTDVEAATVRVRALGGAVAQDPFDAPGLGRVAIVTDPQGARFSLVERGPQEA
ncbi:MAG TPA: VOC family protein [Gemmatimonadales bacterium]|nr:VOC family protein [Gemmatimonadales bacterium]